MREEWRPVVGYEGLYEVSNRGNVKSLERTVWDSRGYFRTIPERILKPKKDSGGYLQVHLSKDGKDKWHTVHRLVATVFCDNPHGFKEVNHIDEDKTNNCADNLEFCSRSYNVNYGTRNQRISKPIYSINKVSGLIMYWTSAKEAGNVLGIHSANITRCCKGKLNSAGNHYWFYADNDTTE